EYQEKLLRFLENHDEPRAAAMFSPEKERAAAVIATTLPGARLFHDGQMEGRRVRLPVYLSRRPDAPVDQDLRAFYGKLLTAVRDSVFHNGQWRLCDGTGWSDNVSFRNLLAWTWVDGEERRLIVVNLSDAPAQARIPMLWENLGGEQWRLTD